MQHIIATAVATILLLGFAFIGLMIGRLITGKNRLKRGSCQRAAADLKQKECDQRASCSLCAHSKSDKGPQAS